MKRNQSPKEKTSLQKESQKGKLKIRKCWKKEINENLGEETRDKKWKVD